MKAIVNKPLASTFSWLHVNGTRADLPEEAESLEIRLKEGEERILTLQSPVNITAELGENASFTLIQLRRGGENAEASDIRVRCGENAAFAWYRLVLGGAETFDNCSVTLDGNGSSFSADLGYRLDGTEKLDVNCEAIHTGKRTKSRIRASGALSGQAFKLLRGTIDLRTGCAGAEGDELEDVLLMDETVRNQSVPVILCAEEDVTGNHGATIGRLDESLAYYLESRGIDRQDIAGMMAKAKLDAVIRKLPDTALRRELLGEEEEA